MKLLERRAEIERLEVALDEAARGSGKVVLIAGEAGIGKSALVSDFWATHSAAADVLVGTCDDLFTPRPFGPLWDMSRGQPELAQALETGDRDALYVEVSDRLERSLRPTVWIIEDLHWADGATLDLVRYLGRRIHGRHGLLVATYRDNEVTPDHPLRAVLGDLPPGDLVRMRLAPLSVEAVNELAGTRDRARRIHGLTNGNPFLVTEMLAASRSDDLPSSIIDSVMAQVARLSSRARGLVETLSLVPGRAEMSLVRDLVDEWSGAVDDLVRHALVEVAGPYLKFRHELARQVVAHALPPGRSSELNRKLLEHRITHGADASLIVHHAVAAGDGDAIVAYSPLAARNATSMGSHREAYRYYETLRPFYGRLDPPERASLLFDWSVAASVVNELEQAERLADEAIALWRKMDQPLALGSSLRWRSRVAWLRGAGSAAAAYVAEAVGILEPLGASAELAQAFSAQAQLAMLANQPDRAVEFAGRAIATARPLGENRIVAHAMVNLGSSWTNGAYPGNVGAIEEAIRFARREGFQEEVVRGTVNYSWGALLARDLDTAEAYAAEAADVADNSQLAAFSQYARATLALVKLMKGDVVEADRIAESIHTQSEIGPTTKILVGTVRGTLLARRGDPAAGPILDETSRLAARTREVQRTGMAAAALAELAWITGEHGSIYGLIEGDLAEAANVGVRWIAADLFLWAWRSGCSPPPPPGLPAPHTLLVGGDWRSAAGEWRRLGMPYEEALALGHGDAEAMVRAIEILDDLDAKVVAERFRSDLRASGVSSIPRGPRSATRSHPLGLTPRQAEVMELVSQGLSNPAIAERMFISRRTVEHHVSAILTKLGVSSREDAVAKARGSGMEKE